MIRIQQHPILDVTPSGEYVNIRFKNKTIKAEKGKTIAAALHQAGFPVHSHSLRNRERSLECGIGKCGACEMLVDGVVKRICITKVDQVKEVAEIPKNYKSPVTNYQKDKPIDVFFTTVAIIGAGPAGLACREELNRKGIENLVIDNNDKIGGQFTMQTHQFFFFENEKKFGGMRGFDIAKTLAGDNHDGILLNSTVWDILDGGRLAVKNIENGKIYYVEASYLVIATGAVPFMPAFENDDLPGVYTAAVVQKMMNNEFTLLGKNILTVGAGNIGYLTSYQARQAGANVKAIIEAMPYEGGFPVQANRVRRLGIPILTSHTLVKAIPNADNTGITGAVIVECKNFVPIAGTEKVIDGIDAINICTGLIPDDQLLEKGKEIFGRKVFGAGDAIRIGEGTSAVLRGRQVAFEIFQEMGIRFDYDEFLKLSKEYIDSQQHPLLIIDKPVLPGKERLGKPFVQIDCLYGFACNPCAFACPYGAITKSSSSTVPAIDFDKCIGCMQCVTLCPGLAIFGYNLTKQWLFFPVEFDVAEKSEVFVVDNNGKIIGEGILEKVTRKENKTHLARIKTTSLEGEAMLAARGFILKSEFPGPISYKESSDKIPSEKYICHCEDITLEEVVDAIGKRKFISVDEVKHITRLGMGSCRGKRCIKRLRSALGGSGIHIIDEATPRGPMSNQLSMGELYPGNIPENIITHSRKTIKIQALVAGGGIAGSSAFRYLAEAGLKPVMINFGRGASWRNIAGGRPVFSVPELADIAMNNLRLFKELQKTNNINFRNIRYVTFAHDDATYEALEKSREWSDAFIVEPKNFARDIAPGFNPGLKTYRAAFVTHNCWQATPGLTIEALRNIGLKKGGIVMEDCRLINVEKAGNGYRVLVKTHENEYIEYQTNIFINALGNEAHKFAKKLGYDLGLYPVKHQAFITQRLPFLGINGNPLDMLIDRRRYKGFSAVYGQQLHETGQIIGCASPAVDAKETDKNVKINDKDFLEIVSEVFVDWLPALSSVSFQATWAGYYIEPRLVVDTDAGLLVGLRGQGFMLGQYLAKIYVDKLMGRPVPDYFSRLAISGDGLEEKAFK